jgi:hypothetical protein
MIFRGSRVGMLLKIPNPVLETRCGDVEEHQPARIRKRSRSGPQRESEGSIVPLEDTGQHNPVRGKGPCFVHATKEWRIGDCPRASHPAKHQDTSEEALPQGQAGTGLPLLRFVRQGVPWEGT